MGDGIGVGNPIAQLMETLDNENSSRLTLWHTHALVRPGTYVHHNLSALGRMLLLPAKEDEI